MYMLGRLKRQRPAGRVPWPLVRGLHLHSFPAPPKPHHPQPSWSCCSTTGWAA